MMEAARTSETLVNFYQTTRCYNPEDSNLHTHRHENLKSYLIHLASEQGPVVGSGEHGNEPSGSIKCGELLLAEHTIYYLLKKYSASWSWLVRHNSSNDIYKNTKSI
jgi:hypothetical protein